MSFKVDLKGFKELESKLRNLPAKSEAVLRDELAAFGQNTVADAKRNLTTEKAIDEGFLRNSISAQFPITSKGFAVEIVVAADYAAYVEFGTRKFAAQYVSSLPPDWQTFAAKFKGGGGGGSYEQFLQRIMEWVKRKGFAAERTKSGGKSQSKSSIEAQEQAAYLIARSIMKNGIKQKPFLYPAVEKNKIELIKRLKANL